MSRNLFDLNDKVVVVTGGMGQLGRQFVKTLSGHNARIVILDIAVDHDQVGTAFADIPEDRLFAFSCDITSREQIEQALEKIQTKWETPFGLINNAALDSPPGSPASENGPFENYPEDSWDKVMEVNSKGVFLLCQVFGGAMAAAGKGSIVNVSSIYGVVSPNQDIYQYRRDSGEEFYKPVAYSASKSSLLNLTRYLATYWAKRSVRVNTLVLGGVFNNQDAEFLKGYCNRIPIGRMANPDEYNGSIIFLMSDASSYMTGSEMVLDGGWTAW